MKLPFHGVHVSGGILFTARGGSINSFSLSDGSHVSTWKYPVEAKDEKKKKAAGAKTPSNGDRLVIEVSEGSTPAPSQDEQGPPAKRVKLENGKASPPGEAQKDADVKPAEEDQGKRTAHKEGKRSKKPGPRHPPWSRPSDRPMVNIMTSTSDERHLVAVTSDKSIWVFEHDGQGQLKQLSRRTMPKRPCSLTLTPDTTTTTILCADKFGDVYSLPLLPTDDPAPEQQQQSPPPPPKEPSPATRAPMFTPQATELTVHTGRNRQALIDQQISARRGTPKQAGGAPFERTLLLGHVSMLTAIALGHDSRGRPYILTADRDEHVRVSRGAPGHAHVVESFCLGHDEFVNRLCVRGALLVSGGGDSDLFVWRWREGALLARTPLLSIVREVVRPDAAKVAVTGLCAWSAGGDDDAERILVICERIPAIFIYTLKAAGSLEYSQALKIPGNPLEVATIGDNKLAVAVDPAINEADYNSLTKSLLKVEYENGEYHITEDLVKDVSMLEEDEAGVSSEELSTLLYSAENLRKVESEDGGADVE